MPDYQTQVVLPMDSAVGRDVVVNTWHPHVSESLAVEAALQSWHTALATFYSSLSTVLDRSVAAALVRMKTYDLDDPQPRQAILDELKPITEPTVGAPLPHELCAVLSFNSEFLSGVNPARRRGRIFIGPLKASVMGTETGDPKLTSAARTTIANAAKVVADRDLLDEPSQWHTRSSFPSANDNAAVVAGYVDDSFDIQRRRGTVSTARTSFSAD